MAVSASLPIAVPTAYIDLYAQASGFASTAGVLVQNISQTDTVWLFYGSSAPSSVKQGMMLTPGQSYYDKNGSANAWAMSMTGLAKVVLSKD